MRCSSWPAWLKQAVGDPAALILDEPANGLDPRGIAWLRNLLQDYAR
jgi:ABC-2 type transport system ATP-binding protein